MQFFDLSYNAIVQGRFAMLNSEIHDEQTNIPDTDPKNDIRTPRLQDKPFLPA
jgi:hypothetical protein